MHAAFLQFEPAYLDPETNLSRVERLLEGADCDLVVLPELCTSGYYFGSRDEVARIAEPVPGPATERLARWTRRSGATMVAGIAERAGDRFFNSAVTITPQGVVSSYRKVHLYFEEKLHFAPGDGGFPVAPVQTRDGTPYGLGVMICFDWYYPEAARTLALRGADVIAHPANLVRPDCPRAMPIRALENHVFTITANRTGRERKGGGPAGENTPELTFIGQSETCDPDGAVLLRAGRSEELLGVVEIDPARARDRRLTTHNDLLADRRPTQYTRSASL